jgi:PAS domain S-box-containing protein
VQDHSWLQETNSESHPSATFQQMDELQQLYEQAPCGYHSLDANGMFVRVNQTELNMLGYSREELIGHKSFFDLLTPASQQVFTTNFPLFKQRGWISDLEFDLVRKDSSILPVSLSSKAIKDADGNYLVSRSVMIDISNRKQLEKEHQQAENDLNEARQDILAIWESMTDAYVILDLNWNFVYINPAAMMMFSQLGGINDPTTLLGKSHWEVFPETIGKIIELEYRRAVAEQVPTHFESLDEASGYWAEIHAYPSPSGLGIYFRDITERKHAQEKIQEQANLLSIASDAIYVHDPENRILFWNRAAERLYDCSADEMMGQDWRQLLSAEAFSELDDELLGQDTWQGEVTKRTQSGKAIIVMSRRSTMLDEAGKIKSILTVDTDITEKKQLESQFLRAQRLESLGMLASGIAHDLNNVLTPIIGIVQLLPLKMTNLDPQIQRLLEILNDSAHRGADLVKQILSFTRGIEGKPTNVQIGHLIAETQKIIQETFPKNIDLLVDLPTDLWLTAADATLLHQVFLNLCVNARDAMPKGGSLNITAENLEIDENYARMNLEAEAGAYVVITISDTGMGIPAEIVDRIFDPFFTTKDIGKGTGLGLSTVMGVIKSHHGFISVYSEMGKGTRFKVYLPATEDSNLDPVVKNELLFGNGELILVVDDELAVQEVTKATLETHGYQTILANDGIEAIALFAERKKEISAVLLDMMMPSLDSVTIIRTLSKLSPQVQIIAMSGLATNESVTKMHNEGVKAFLSKPFTAQELLQPLALICNSKDYRI